MRDEVVLVETDPRAGLTHALVEYVTFRVAALLLHRFVYKIGWELMFHRGCANWIQVGQVFRKTL
jgi:hypothetical protein